MQTKKILYLSFFLLILWHFIIFPKIYVHKIHQYYVEHLGEYQIEIPNKKELIAQSENKHISVYQINVSPETMEEIKQALPSKLLISIYPLHIWEEKTFFQPLHTFLFEKNIIGQKITDNSQVYVYYKNKDHALTADCLIFSEEAIYFIPEYQPEKL